MHEEQKFSLLGFMLAITCLILAIGNWPEERSASYFIISAVILFVGSAFVEVVGVYKAKHFSVEAAQRIYQSVMQLINELSVISLTLHEH